MCSFIRIHSPFWLPHLLRFNILKNILVLGDNQFKGQAFEDSHWSLSLATNELWDQNFRMGQKLCLFLIPFSSDWPSVRHMACTYCVFVKWINKERSTLHSLSPKEETLKNDGSRLLSLFSWEGHVFGQCNQDHFLKVRLPTQFCMRRGVKWELVQVSSEH